MVELSTAILLGLAMGMPSANLIGTWSSTAPGDATVSYTFRADGTLTWTNSRGEWTGTFEGRYTVDFKRDPVEIDIFDLQPVEVPEDMALPPLPPNARLLAILSFEGEDTFRMTGQYSSEGVTGRPRGFSGAGDVLMFKRADE